MKAEIHPTYYTDATIDCMSCGAKYKVGGIMKELKVEVCSGCHPFYTGKQDHLLDTAGRVDKFKAKMEKAKAIKDKEAEKKASKMKKDTDEE